MTLPTDRTVFQHAWVVDDLEAAVERWATTMGIGPFFLRDHSDDLVDTMYRGEPASLSMRRALAQARLPDVLKREGKNRIVRLHQGCTRARRGQA